MPTSSPVPEPPAAAASTRTPSLLVSYVNLKPWLAHKAAVPHRSWVLDSGAYSALTSGKVIDLARFTDDAANLLQTDPRLEAVFALDVIGDPEASLRNAEAMWSAGVPAIPTFHYGSAPHYLADLARRSEKIALGGLVARGAGGHGSRLTVTHRLDFIQRCFSEVWPKWVHGFGCGDERIVKRVPLASVDSTTWLYSVMRYGGSSVYGSQTVPRSSVNKSAVDAAVQHEIAHHARLERIVRSRWSAVMKQHGLPPFTLRLAVGGGSEYRHLKTWGAGHE